MNSSIVTISLHLFHFSLFSWTISEQVVSIIKISKQYFNKYFLLPESFLILFFSFIILLEFWWHQIFSIWLSQMILMFRLSLCIFGRNTTEVMLCASQGTISGVTWCCSVSLLVMLTWLTWLQWCEPAFYTMKLLFL